MLHPVSPIFCDVNKADRVFAANTIKLLAKDRLQKVFVKKPCADLDTPPTALFLSEGLYYNMSA